jgi:hypothetical protein
MNFRDWYKNMIESAGQEPPAAVWEEIQNELDLDKVWAGIDKELQGTRKKRSLYILQAAASVLLLMSIGTYFLINTGNGEMNELSIQPGRSEGSMLPDNDTQLGPESGTSESPALFSVHQSREFPVAQYEGTSGTKFDELHLRPEISLKPVKSVIFDHVRQDYHLIASKGSSDRDFGNDGSIDRPWFELSGYYAGLSGHLGNTWLLNNKTLQGLKSYELTASLPSFGYSAGLIAGKKIGRRLDIQAEVFLFPGPARITTNIFMVNMLLTI